ncbi:MAG: hypothetical protein AB1668_01205 [Nanoarchaeota archaeon]
MKKAALVLIIFVFLAVDASATILKGNIYDSKLELESNVLVGVNTTPQQKYLSKDGTYLFELPPGRYVLTAESSEYQVKEEINVVSEQGAFIYDLFLLPDFAEEDELWEETEREESVLPQGVFLGTFSAISGFYSELSTREKLSYLIAGLIFIYAIYRIIAARKKYGPLNLFRKRMKEEQGKSIEQHREEILKEPGYLDKALEIIRKHEGRITQKELRREMLYLSEAKISLILTELEHKGWIEKIKKGRGNVIILKEK